MMKHFFIGLTFDRLGMTPYVIRGDIATSEDFENNIEFNGTLDFETFQEEYQNTVLEYDLSQLREQRNKLLEETDWWELPSQLPMSDERANYRQALRDITETYSSLEEVVWPEKPE